MPLQDEVGQRQCLQNPVMNPSKFLPGNVFPGINVSPDVGTARMVRLSSEHPQKGSPGLTRYDVILLPRKSTAALIFGILPDCKPDPVFRKEPGYETKQHGMVLRERGHSDMP
jgi:hypothetical protein